jgi:hypothetical protein
MIAAAKVIAPMMAKTIRSMKGMRYKWVYKLWLWFLAVMTVFYQEHLHKSFQCWGILFSKIPLINESIWLYNVVIGRSTEFWICCVVLKSLLY